MTVWFTSDLHFGHESIIQHSHRPFQSVEQMDVELVANWVDRIAPGDRVYVLGDISFHNRQRTDQLLEMLPGQKYLIAGNHDVRFRKNLYPAHFTWVRDLTKIKVDGQRIILCHYALLTWEGQHRGSWMLHGHSHGNLRPDMNQRRTDVGVDSWNWGPVSFEQIRDRMERREEFEPIDHHGERHD